MKMRVDSVAVSRPSKEQPALRTAYGAVHVNGKDTAYATVEIEAESEMEALVSALAQGQRPELVIVPSNVINLSSTRSEEVE